MISDIMMKRDGVAVKEWTQKRDARSLESQIMLLSIEVVRNVGRVD